ncbi:hypothetical protein AWR36_009815 [Microbulbifer flavimaris]|uniref:Uncharacterized protein n=1 Tax=Microbulbifer flavimaris TaxID=1781068 RepID=A0ABX4HY13_9GAMM|nr:MULTISPECIES: DUF6515 family protein [Microbulbifer]KUJ82848.1 hypothetical protein AVO43_09790 [Microbulbifer sp. ZGT114]PCO05024.1 hypothetical protein AWR36_009815 [Microbulbifer flavimaris]
MKILRFLIGAAGLLALGAFAFAPPADARTAALERHGGHHHHWKHHHWKRHHHGPRFRGPRISVGFTVPVLPRGYLSLAVGGRPYYFHSGHFYRHGPAGYVVVSAPLGASVVSLPASAVQVQIGGAVFYQYANAYYQWHPARRAYVVVPPPAGAVAVPAAAATPTSPGTSPYSPGQVLDSLPAGYTAEVINGVQYYRYGNDYFMPTQRDGREVYVVVQI